MSKLRVVLLERARGRQGTDPVVVDALAVHELEPEIAQARDPGQVSPERRVHRILDNDNSIAGFPKANRGVRYAHVGLKAGQQRGPTSC